MAIRNHSQPRWREAHRIGAPLHAAMRHAARMDYAEIAARLGFKSAKCAQAACIVALGKVAIALHQSAPE